MTRDWYANTDERDDYDTIDRNSEYGSYMRNRRMITDCITPLIKNNGIPSQKPACKSCHIVFKLMDDGITHYCERCGYRVRFLEDIQAKKAADAAKKPRVRPKESSADNKFFVKQLPNRRRGKSYDETQRAMMELGWELKET